MSIDILYILLIVAFGLFMFLLGRYLAKPPIVGNLTVDVMDWDSDRFSIDINPSIPLVDLPDYKVVGLKVRPWPAKVRGDNNSSNEAD